MPKHELISNKCVNCFIAVMALLYLFPVPLLLSGHGFVVTMQSIAFCCAFILLLFFKKYINFFHKTLLLTLPLLYTLGIYYLGETYGDDRYNQASAVFRIFIFVYSVYPSLIFVIYANAFYCLKDISFFYKAVIPITLYILSLTFLYYNYMNIDNILFKLTILLMIPVYILLNFIHFSIYKIRRSNH